MAKFLHISNGLHLLVIEIYSFPLDLKSYIKITKKHGSSQSAANNVTRTHSNKDIALSSFHTFITMCLNIHQKESSIPLKFAKQTNRQSKSYNWQRQVH